MNINESNFKLLPCPCCGSKTISEKGKYEICSVCCWEDDPIQVADPDYPGGANKCSLNQAKAKWSARKSDK
jgi:hypothetical protein